MRRSDLPAKRQVLPPQNFPLFTLYLCPATSLDLAPLQPPCRQSLHTRQYAVTRRTSMSVLDGVSLLLAVGLFIYLLVALLRADRN